MAEILLKLALNTNQSIIQNWAKKGENSINGNN